MGSVIGDDRHIRGRCHGEDHHHDCDDHGHSRSIWLHFSLDIFVNILGGEDGRRRYGVGKKNVELYKDRTAEEMGIISARDADMRYE